MISFYFMLSDKTIFLPISLNPTEHYFLFSRPLTYFFFWLDYNSVWQNPVLYKFHSVLWLLLNIIILYKVILEFNKNLTLDTPKIIIFLLLLFYILHPDTLMAIYWISNRNELISTSFYLLSLYYFLLFRRINISKYLIYSSLFFVFSALAKQSAIHLPLILIILNHMLFQGNIKESRKATRWFFTFIFSFFCIISVINTINNGTELYSFIHNAWKKPLAIIGSTLFSMQPYIGNIIFNYFLMHKSIAIIFLVILIAAVLILYRQNKIPKGKKLTIIISFTLIYIISFYPRIFVATGRRINSFQIIWIIVLIAFVYNILSEYKWKKVVLLAIVTLTIANLFTLINDLSNEKKLNSIRENMIENLRKIYTDNTFIVVAPDILLIPYQLHYHIYKDFGKAVVHSSSIHYRSVDYSMESHKWEKIRCLLQDSTYSVYSLEDKIYLDYDTKEEKEILQLYNSKVGRNGFQKIVARRPQKFSEMELIYFDGNSWLQIEK